MGGAGFPQGKQPQNIGGRTVGTGLHEFMPSKSRSTGRFPEDPHFVWVTLEKPAQSKGSGPGSPGTNMRGSDDLLNLL